MRVGEIDGTGHVARIVFNAKMEEIRRESMLTELRQRVREVRQGPDGFIYLLNDKIQHGPDPIEDRSALLGLPTRLVDVLRQPRTEA